MPYETITAHPQLIAHNDEFKREIINVAPGIHFAIGYGLANSILIEGEEGVIIVDTLGSSQAAAVLKADFDPIRARRPIKAIIYTHNHGDHTFGAGVMAGDDTPEIIAHDSTQHYMERVVGKLWSIILPRTLRQLGEMMPEAWHTNAGLGASSEAARGLPSILWPTKTFKDRWATEIAGVKLELIHTPGETNDTISIWLPDAGVMISGDNFYRSFPNLYAIRGTPHRDVMQWARSLDIVRQYNPHVLLPMHSRPVIGRDNVYRHVTDYRDAIQYVHDQTVRWMNMGLKPDEIVQRVKLPAHLASSPYLQEFYGAVSWSVRSVFNGYLGFFSGEAADLEPLSPDMKSAEMVELAGGTDAMRQKAATAYDAGKHQWALELATHLLRLNSQDDEARSIRYQALLRLGEQQKSANGRHYYLTQALETSGAATLPTLTPNRVSPQQAAATPISTFFEILSCSVDPDKCLDLELSIRFDFTDLAQGYTVYIRRGVAEVAERLADSADISITCTSITWKGFFNGSFNPIAAQQNGDIRIEGATEQFPVFLGVFRNGLNRLQARTLRTFCNTIFPAVETDSADENSFWQRKASDMKLEKLVASQLLSLPPARQNGLIRLLELLDLQGLNKLDQPRREALLGKLRAASPQAAMGINGLIQMTLFNAYGLPNNPNWEAIKYPGPPAKGKPTAKTIVPYRPTSKRETLTADVCIIGSGAGGGVIAGELASRGHKVIVLEAGGYFNRSDFNSEELWGYQNLYWRGGWTVTDDDNVRLISGQSLGGGTTVNWTNCVQPPAWVLEEWASKHGVEGVDSAEFAQHLQTVMQRISANNETSDYNGSHQRMSEAAEKLGYAMHKAYRNIDKARYDPETAGFVPFGDAGGSRQDTTRTYLQTAFDHGATIVTHCRAEHIVVEEGRAVGVVAQFEGRDRFSAELCINAKQIVVACGGLETPALLLRSKIGGDNVGKHLRLHPACVVNGLYPDDQKGWWGAPQAAVCDQFANIEDGYGFLIEGALYSPGLLAASNYWESGRQHKRLMTEFHRRAVFVAVIRDRGAGQVTIDANGQVVIHYPPTDNLDVQHVREALRRLIGMHVAAGASEIRINGVHDTIWRTGEDVEQFVETISNKTVGGAGVTLLSAHQMGSARMGQDATSSVANPFGELHDTANVWIGDTSAFPTASGANPMITCMALARRTALEINERLNP